MKRNLISIVFSSVIALSLLAASFSTPLETEMATHHKGVDHNTILELLMPQGTKTVFKVWHFLMDKKYDYNTQEGIRKYKVFTQNLKKMQEHNSKDLSWKMGLNFLSDMTESEVFEYYSMKEIDDGKINRSLRALGSVSLDDYNDEEEIRTIETPKVGAISNFNFQSKMSRVRNQGQCGSCWSFSAMASIEGCRRLWHNDITDFYSTQLPVDCGGGGTCNGGSSQTAIQFFAKNNLVYEAGYKYTGVNGTCKYKAGMVGDTKLRVSKVLYFGMSGYTYDQLVTKGPTSTSVLVEDTFMRYRSGIYDGGVCKGTTNHAINLVGYSNTEGGYFIVRNSWGESWGEKGYMRIKDNNAKLACTLKTKIRLPEKFISGV